MPDRAVPLHPAMQALGPDLLASDFDAAEAERRLRARPQMQIAEALLDQRALAGIGNVYKSETLFIERINPWTRVADVPDAALVRLVATAHRLLHENVRPGSPHRITTRRDLAGRGSLWVYGRAGRPCLRCGTPIQTRRQGELNRSTYWCPTCQPTLH